jgi:hypothetical protein
VSFPEKILSPQYFFPRQLPPIIPSEPFQSRDRHRHRGKKGYTDRDTWNNASVSEKKVKADYGARVEKGIASRQMNRAYGARRKTMRRKAFYLVLEAAMLLA